MKKFFLVASLVLPMSVFANTIHFKCVSVDVPGVHTFDASGLVTIDDTNNVEGIISVNIKKAQTIESLQTFADVKVEGVINHYNAGDFEAQAFDQLVLKSNETYLKSLSLLLNSGSKFASRILSIDNFAYRANCKVITE